MTYALSENCYDKQLICLRNTEGGSWWRASPATNRLDGKWVFESFDVLPGERTRYTAERGPETYEIGQGADGNQDCQTGLLRISRDFPNFLTCSHGSIIICSPAFMWYQPCFVMICGWHCKGVRYLSFKGNSPEPLLVIHSEEAMQSWAAISAKF